MNSIEAGGDRGGLRRRFASSTLGKLMLGTQIPELTIEEAQSKIVASGIALEFAELMCDTPKEWEKLKAHHDATIADINSRTKS